MLRSCMISVLLACLCCPVVAQPRQWNPPLPLGPKVLTVGFGGQYATITAAFSAAQPGDTVLLLPGEYGDDVTTPAGVSVVALDPANTRASVEFAGNDRVPLKDGTFARNSLAYECDGESMVAKAPDVARTKTILSCNASVGSRLDTTHNKAVFLHDGELFVGRGNDSAAEQAKLYTSPDAVTWTLAETFTGADPSIRFVWELQGGRLLALVKAGGVYSLWRSGADDYTDWTQVATNFPGEARDWSFHQRAGGTAVLGVYDAQTVASALWRSDDNGATWSSQFALRAGQITHFHAVFWHPGTAKWIASTGDPAAPAHREYLFVSEDDGVSWDNYDYFEPFDFHIETGAYTTLIADSGPFTTDHLYRLIYLSGPNITAGFYRINAWASTTTITLDAAPCSQAVTGSAKFLKCTPGGQDTRYRDYGHPTRVLVGSDWYHKIYWLDLVDWSMDSFVDDDRGLVTSPYTSVFEVFKHDDLWYATTHSQIATAGAYDGLSVAVWVSPDLAHWQLYHRVPFSARIEGLLPFIGEVDGLLHFGCRGYTSGASGWDWGHYTLTPARVSTITGTVLTPSKRNLLPLGIARAVEDNDEGSVQWVPHGNTNKDPEHAMPVEGAHFESLGAMKLSATKPVFAGINTYFTGVAASTNLTYLTNSRITGDSLQVDVSASDTNALGGRAMSCWPSPNRWVSSSSGPYLHPNGNIRPNWTIYRDPATEDVLVRVACSELIQAPYAGEWCPESYAGTIGAAVHANGSTTITATSAVFGDDGVIGQEFVASSGTGYRVTARTDTTHIVVEGDASGESDTFYTRQAAESLVHNLTLPISWTHVFAAEIMPSVFEFGENTLVLATYKRSSTEYVQLYARHRPTQDEVADWTAPAASGYTKVSSDTFDYSKAAVGQLLRLRAATYGDAGVAGFQNYGWFTIIAVDAGNKTLTLDRTCAGGTGDKGPLVGTSYDFVFGLQSFEGGSPEDSIETTNHHLHRFSLVRLAVRYYAGQMRLSVVAGGPVEHVEEVLSRGGQPLHGATGAIIFADVNGLNVVPMVVGDSYLYHAMGDSTLATLMENASFAMSPQYVP